MSKKHAAAAHILLTGSHDNDQNDARAYSGYVRLSPRLRQNAVLTGISPRLAPGLAVGDFLVIGSDYTHTVHDPYSGAASAPLPILSNTTMTPRFFQNYAALRAGVSAVTAVTAVTATRPDGASATLHTPEMEIGGVADGVSGGRALVSISPPSLAGRGTYVFRLVRIVAVPANPAAAYSGDIYELGVTLSAAQTRAWGAA